MKFFIQILILITILFPIKVFAISKKNSEFKIVAKVNNEAITEYDLDNRYKIIRLSLKESKTKTDNQNIYKQALEQLIEDKIKEQDILKKKISIDDELVVDYIFGIEKQKNMPKGGLKKYLKRNGIDYKNYTKKIKNDLMWGKLIQNNIQSNVVVLDYEVNEAVEYIIEKPDRIRFNISEIYIPISEREGKSEVQSIANELVREIKKNNNFEEIVNKFSRSSSAENFGNIGWLDENDLSSNIFNKIKDLNKGEISEPLFISNYNNGGYYIFKLNNIKKERIVKEVETDRVRSVIYNQKINIAIKKYLDELYKDAFIEIL